MSKGFAPILIVILIALAIGGYLLYQKQTKPFPVSQPSPSPVTTPVASISAETINKKKGTNNEFFVLKLPVDWKESKVGVSSDLIDRKEYKNSVSDSEISILVKKDAYQEFVQERESMIKPAKPQSVKISGEDALKYDGFGGEAGRLHRVDVIIKKGEYAFWIIFNTQVLPEGKENISIFDQILSTFKFTQ